MKLASRFSTGRLRTVVLAVFAVMLLVRLGPICETAAQAAPVTSVMAGCADGHTPAPAKKTTQSACATPCVAVPGEALARIEAAPLPPVSPWPAPTTNMAGRLTPPATPPPRNV